MHNGSMGTTPEHKLARRSLANLERLRALGAPTATLVITATARTSGPATISVEQLLRTCAANKRGSGDWQRWSSTTLATAAGALGELAANTLSDAGRVGQGVRAYLAAQDALSVTNAADAPDFVRWCHDMMELWPSVVADACQDGRILEEASMLLRFQYRQRYFATLRSRPNWEHDVLGEIASEHDSSNILASVRWWRRRRTQHLIEHDGARLEKAVVQQQEIFTWCIIHSTRDGWNNQGLWGAEIYGYLAACGIFPGPERRVVRIPRLVASLDGWKHTGTVAGDALPDETYETIASMLPLHDSGMSPADALDAARLLAQREAVAGATGA